MLAVSAKATTCEPQTEGTPDNATQPKPHKPEDLDTQTGLFSTPDVTDAMDASTRSDPSALAARILQRSASSGAEVPERPKKPVLTAPEDSPLEMPGILTPSGSQDWAPRRRSRSSSRVRTSHYGPSFKALLASTLLLAAAGSGAIALGLPDLVAGSNGPVLEVETQTILAAPKQDRTGGNSTIAAAATDLTSQTAQPAQPEKAKDRIRQAFAETSPSETTLPRQSSGQSAASVAPTEPDASQTINATAGTPHAARGANQTTSLSGPVIASAAADPNAPGTQAPAAAGPASGSAPLEPQTSPDAQSAAKPAENQVELDETSGRFSETGKVTASVNLRQTDAKNGTIIGLVPEGAEVRYTGCGKWWCEIRYDGKTGFVGQKFVQR